MKTFPSLAALLACVTACAGSATPMSAPAPVEPQAPPAATCARVAGHTADLVAVGLDPPPPDDAVNALISLIRTRCEEDAWSPEARQCLSTMQTAADADRCGTLLTEEQQAALVRDQEAMLGVAGPAVPTSDEND